MAVDKTIRVSLHGSGPSGFGLTKDGDVVSRNRLIAPYDNSKRVVFFDDFFGDVIADQWSVVEGADTTTSDAAVVSGINGICRLTTGDSATLTYAGNGIGITFGAFYNFKAEDGGLSFEARLKLSAITTVKLFVGFTDLGTFEAPIEGSGTANGITTNASDAVGIIFDTSMTTANFWGVGVKADTDATALNLGVAPVADTFVILKIEVDKDGAAKFFVNGQGRGGGVMSNAVTKTVGLTPAVYATSLVAATRTIDVDYVDVRKDRY
jgi:hypothetical protein